jgi:RNA polymerase sigma-70 factor (ECF subfamily)
VGDGDGPAIASNAGRGAIHSWVIVAALRESVRQRHKAAREPAVEDDALIALADRGASSDAIDKQRYREAFRTAFRAALAALSPRDRNLLRLHVIDELSIDEISTLHGVHRATAARWVEQAREQVSRGVRRDLMQQLGIDPFEASELLEWVKSRVELSLSGLAKS